MFKIFLKFANSHWRLFVGISVLLVCFLAFGQTLRMYFWQDDNAVIFKVQNIEGPAGTFGTGIYDKSSSYRFVATINYPFYLLFSIKPEGYYLVGIIFYFFASLSVYFLANTLTKNKNSALVSALIFATGIVGAESVWRIATSLHTSHLIAAMCVCLGLYVLSFTSSKRKKLFYVLSLVTFAYTMETGYIRAHGILLALLGIELFLNLKFSRLIISILRVLPFVYLYTRWYSDSRSVTWLGLMKQKIFDEGRLDLLLSPFKSLQNMLIPSQFSFPFFIFVLAIVIVLLWKRNRLFFVAITLMMAPVVVPYITNQGEIFESTHRYITTSGIGSAIFISVLLSRIFKNTRRYYYVSLLLVAFYLLVINKQEYSIVKYRSTPIRKFYESLLSSVPKLPKGSAILFDVEDDAVSRQQYNDFLAVGSMPTSTSIALHYKIDRYDLYLPENFEELLSLVKKGAVESDKIYTFYYSAKGGLVNTSDLTRSALFGKNTRVDVANLDKIEKNFSSPLQISSNLSASINREKIVYSKSSVPNLSKYLRYLISKTNYYVSVSATAVSEWKYHEIRYISDQDKDTSWMGHRIHWHYENSDSVVLDLKQMRNIGALRMIYPTKNVVPTAYSISCSSNNKEWKLIDTFSFVPPTNQGIIFNKFTPTSCKYIKLDFSKTFNGDSPQLSEIEAIDSEFVDLDFNLSDEIEHNPFEHISSALEVTIVEEFLKKSGMNASLCLLTDKSKVSFCQSFKLFFNQSKNYSIIATPNGTKLLSAQIKVPKEVILKVTNFSLFPLTYSQLSEMGYIIEYKEN